MKRLDIELESPDSRDSWEQRLAAGSPLLRYSLALLVALVVLAATLAVPVLRTSSPFILPFGAIALAAWYAGIGPALLVIVVTTMTISLVVEPFSVWRVLVTDAVRLGVFTLVAAGITTLASSKRQATMELRRQNDRLEAVHGLSVAARGSAPIDEVYAQGVEAVRTALGAERTAVFVMDEDDTLALVASHRLPALARESDAHPRVGWRRTTSGTPLLVSDLETPPPAVAADLRRALLVDGVRSAGWFPLLSHERVIGELVVGYDGPTEIDQRRVLLGETIATHLAHVVERDRAEERLGEGEEQLRLALRAAGMGSWQYQPDTGRVYWSPEVEAIYGLTPGSFPGTLTAFLDRVHPDDRDAVRRALDACVNGEIPEYDVEYRIADPSGETRWLSDVGRVIPRRGRAVRVSGVSIDITDRKETEAARSRLLEAERDARVEVERERDRSAFLAEASAVLGASLDRETMLRSVADVVVPRFADWCAVDLLDDERRLRRVTVAHVDPDKVRWANELHERYPPDPEASHGAHYVIRTGQPEFFGQITDAELAASARSPEHLDQLRAVGFRSAMVVPLVARQSTLGALTLVSAESGRLYSAADLALAEELARRAAIAVDNAQLFRQLEEASRAKDEFLATVSHELRTPLNAILGWSSMLKSGIVPPEKRDQALSTVERNALVLTQLVSDVLDVSRIIAGQLSLDIQPVQLDTVVEAALDVVRPAAAAKGVTLERQTGDGQCSSSLTADPARLQQVIWNLVSNAVKFTPRSGRVTVGFTTTASQVEIVVTDTGEGIEPDFLPLVFDRFRQADGSTTRRHGGLGLGLAIVRHLVELHGGTVEAASRGRGCGSTFTVRLPVSPDVPMGRDKEAPELREAAPGLRKPALTGCRVLAVDDNDDARDLLAYVLEASGAEAKVVGSGEAAMDTFAADWRPDIIVLDIGMPREDGYELLGRLSGRCIDEETQPPLAVALTAHAGPENRARALSAGFDQYVAKPFEPPVLVETLTQLWRKRLTLGSGAR